MTALALLRAVRARLESEDYTPVKVHNDGKMSAIAALLLEADWSLEGPGPNASMNEFAKALGFEDWIKFAEWERDTKPERADIIARLDEAIEREGK